MSSFRRHTSTSESQNASGGPSRAAGVKPWVNSLGIVSIGNRQLDEFIGGGVALGTLTAIIGDTYSNYGDTLIAYNLAQSISLGHATLLLTLSAQENASWLLSLPFNQNFVIESTNEDCVPVETDTKGSDLKIAWQYEKYITGSLAKSEGSSKKTYQSHKTAPSIVSQYCSSYDLSKRLQKSLMLANPVRAYFPEDSEHQDLMSTLSSYMACVEAFILQVNSTDGGAVSRIFLPSLCDLIIEQGSCCPSDEMLVARFLLELKQRIRGTRCTVMVKLTGSSTSPSMLRKVVNMADNVIGIESFAGREEAVPYEFKEFCGFLYIHKLQQIGTLAPFRPPGSRFGLKRDRKKLHVEPLHLPPEESRAFGTAGTDESRTAKLAASAAAAAAPSGAGSAGVRQEISGRGSSLGAVGSTRVGRTVIEFQHDSDSRLQEVHGTALSSGSSSNSISGAISSSSGDGSAYSSSSFKKPLLGLTSQGMSDEAAPSAAAGQLPPRRMTLAERFAKPGRGGAAGPPGPGSAEGDQDAAAPILGASISISSTSARRTSGGGGAAAKQQQQQQQWQPALKPGSSCMPGRPDQQSLDF